MTPSGISIFFLLLSFHVLAQGPGLPRSTPGMAAALRPGWLVNLPRNTATFSIPDSPFPIPDFGHILAIGADIASVFDEFILHFLF